METVAIKGHFSYQQRKQVEEKRTHQIIAAGSQKRRKPNFICIGIVQFVLCSLNEHKKLPTGFVSSPWEINIPFLHRQSQYGHSSRDLQHPNIPVPVQEKMLHASAWPGENIHRSSHQTGLPLENVTVLKLL